MFRRSKMNRERSIKEIVSILPTGFGKSLIYQPLRNVKGNENGASDVVLIVSPLTQKEQLEEKG